MNGNRPAPLPESAARYALQLPALPGQCPPPCANPSDGATSREALPDVEPAPAVAMTVASSSSSSSGETKAPGGSVVSSTSLTSETRARLEQQGLIGQNPTSLWVGGIPEYAADQNRLRFLFGRFGDIRRICAAIQPC